MGRHSNISVNVSGIGADEDEPLEVIQGQYNLYEVLGEGSFGKNIETMECDYFYHTIFIGLVMRGKDMVTGDAVAVKVFKSVFNVSEMRRDDNLKEADMLKRLDHVNIIKLIKVVDDDIGIFLIFPLMTCTLYEEIHKKSLIMSPHRVKAIAIMILSAIEHLNKKKMMHRDLKPNNILVHPSGDIKICDFGLAQIYVEKEVFRKICGTYNYMAPEMLLGFGYGYEVDMWVSKTIFLISFIFLSIYVKKER